MLGKKGGSQSPKPLEVDASFQGNLVFKGEVHLRLNGYFEGNLETGGDLWIGADAVIKARVAASRIHVEGSVIGELAGSSEIRLAPSARVQGELRTPSLILEKGSFFNGQSTMDERSLRKVEPARVFLTVDEVANYLSVERSLIAEWAQAGKIPAGREGEGWRFDKEKVDEWIAKGKVS